MFKQCIRTIILIMVVSLVAACAPGTAEPLQSITPSLLPSTIAVEPSETTLPAASDTPPPTPTHEAPAVTSTSTSRWTRTPRPTLDLTSFGNIGGGMIAFASNRDGDSEIFLMAFPDVEGGSSVEYQLTNNKEDDSVPEWSPDGTKIAFTSERDGNWEIYVMDVNDTLQDTGGAEPQRLTNHESDDLSPAWSPDGTQIAFASKRDGDWEIYVMRADGTNIRQLTDSPGIESKPSWSPDGTKIVFDSGEGYNRDIFIMDSDGSNSELVIHAEGGWPAWSPDGTKIAFFGRSAGNADIYIVNVNGTNLIRMTHDSTDDWEPSWSPDGEWLLYVSGRVTDIFVTRADNSETHRLTHDNFEDWTPVWRPALQE